LRDLDVTKGNIVVDGVEFDPNVFYLRVKDLVFCKAGSGIIIAIDRCASSAGEPEAVQELSQEDGFMQRFIQCSVFSIACRVSNKALFARLPRNNTRAK